MVQQLLVNVIAITYINNFTDKILIQKIAIIMKHLYDNNLKQGVPEYSWSMEMEKATEEFHYVALTETLPAKGMLNNAGKNHGAN